MQYNFDAMHHEQHCYVQHTFQINLCLKSFEIHFLKKGLDLMVFDIMDDSVGKQLQ